MACNLSKKTADLFLCRCRSLGKSITNRTCTRAAMLELVHFQPPSLRPFSRYCWFVVNFMAYNWFNLATIQYVATPVTIFFGLVQTTASTLNSRAATYVQVSAKPAMQSQWAPMTSPVLALMTHGRSGVLLIHWEWSTCTHIQTTVSHILLCKHWNNVHINTCMHAHMHGGGGSVHKH